ncbi:hypothetical protein D6C13_19690 [Rahnella woolbedingensis]|uniref:Uncharacterized protein n=1 Tax=Rahnella woolbedingensis TaxID=1510574 RepID=A0A419N518_9GAMM|nr:hypothetical protein D6C13_19690 [Rahnella woolbedingensis]
MLSMNPFYTSHRIGQLILKRSALATGAAFLLFAAQTYLKKSALMVRLPPLLFCHWRVMW